MKHTPTLKPCPFCGAEMYRGSNGLIFHPDEPFCEMRVPNPSFPLKRWNARPGEDALKAEIVQAVNAHDELLAALESLVKFLDDSKLSHTPSGGVGVFAYEGTEYQEVTDARAAIHNATKE